MTYEGVLAGAAKLYAGNHAMTDSLRVTPEGRIIVSLPQLPATEELESINTNVLLMLRVIAHMKRPC